MKLAQLMDPKVLNSLSAQEVEQLDAAIEADLDQSPEYKQLLKKIVEKHVPLIKGK